MLTNLTSAIRPAIVLTILFALLLGLAYPAAITGIGQLVFPYQANGSLIREGDRVVGSELLAQSFARADYFQPRPSAAGTGYDGLASAGSNQGPASAALKERLTADVAARREQGVTGPLPADMVTTSGSGLDPHVSPETALAQVARVAAARNLPAARITELVNRATEYPLLGFIGERRVNVLMLNRQLDAIGATSPA